MKKKTTISIIGIYIFVFLYLALSIRIYSIPIQPAIYDPNFANQRAILSLAFLVYFIFIGILIGYLIFKYKFKRNFLKYYEIKTGVTFESAMQSNDNHDNTLEQHKVWS